MRGWIAVALAICHTLATLPPARAQNPTIEQYRTECRDQYANMRGPGQRDIVAEHVRACVQAKMRARGQAAVAEPTASDQPLQLLETKAWLVGPTKGPARAKGVIYFVAGYSPERQMLDEFRLVPYYLKSLADDGWDVVRAKLPSDIAGRRGLENVGLGALAIGRRVAELNAAGYKRVIVAGHSWGAWAALLAARDGAAGDALLLSAPNTFGPQVFQTTGRPNPAFHRSLGAFGPALANDKTPTILILPDDNVWDPDPAARGQIAEQYFGGAHIPHLVITKPPGFFGHYAGWLPIFDYAYGGCMRAFLANPAAATSCAPPALANTDFRSIANLKQVAQPHRIVSADSLLGRKFVVYTLKDIDNKYIEYVSSAERVTMLSDNVLREPIAFHDGQQCIAQGCGVLLRWSDHEVLEFDPATGATKAWWIENTAER